MNAWRITQRKHAENSLQREKARALYGGRWNSPGVPMVYLAQSQSLAILEVLVHLESQKLFLITVHVFLEATFELSTRCGTNWIASKRFPKTGRLTPCRDRVQQTGDRLVVRPDNSAILQCPQRPRARRIQLPAEPASILISEKITTSRNPVQFRFDPRLLAAIAQSCIVQGSPHEFPRPLSSTGPTMSIKKKCGT